MHTELHLHTHYSLLDGLNTPEEYLQRAAEIGMTHLAVTDHGNLSAHREFQKYAKETNITPILGCEMYISATERTDRRPVKKRDDNTQLYNHLTVLAKNQTGLENLNKLSEIAWTEGFYFKPRIDMEVLAQYSEGLIVLSGCINGLISRAVESDDTNKAQYFASEFKDIFGDRFFMEIQGHNDPKINHGLLDIAKRYEVAPVVTSDCHYARKEDLWVQEAMLILSTSPKRNYNADMSKAAKMDVLDRYNYLYPDRQISFQKYEIFLRDYKQHEELLAAQGIGTEAIDNTMLVANMVEPYEYYEGLDLLPVSGEDAHAKLRRLTIEGAKKRGTFGIKEYDERREFELGVFGDKEFDEYILAEAEIVNWGRGEGIKFGPGRGSGAGSLVLYELHVTDVDPIPHNLLFFRFVNPERNDFPDVDTDVEDARRGEIKQHILDKYTHAASIATFGKFQGKKAVKDASRVFGVPLGEVNRALKGADFPTNFFEQWNGEKAREFRAKYPKVVELAQYLYGRIREQGMHAGGIVLSKEPINKYAPMQTVKDTSNADGPRIPLVAYDMDAVAEIGLIKYDFLGLKSLTIIRETLEMIKERHGLDIELLDLDYAQPEVYKELSDGYTKGVFQAEGHTFTHWLLEAGAKEFNDLVIGTSIARPGPLTTVGEAFKRRKFKKETVSYVHEVMKPHLEETLGLVIYQEQVMLAMTELAGMKMSTADKVRKIIGKKRDVKEFEQYKSEFVKGAAEKIGEEKAEDLWHDFEAHAGYSFNKSHAVAYSMITYWTAWLKVNYPIEFMTAVLRNENDKVDRLDYLIETKRMGIRVALPDINESGLNFEIQEDVNGEFIRFGLTNIKFIKSKVASKIIAQRPFKNYKEFKAITGTGSGINAPVVKALDYVGATTFLDNPKRGDERDYFYDYLAIPAFEPKNLSPRIKDQLTPLDEFSDDETFIAMGMVQKITRGDGWARIDLVDETGKCSVFTDEETSIETGKMYIVLLSNNAVMRYVTMEELSAGGGGDFADFLGAKSLDDVPPGMVRVLAFRERKTKKGDKMANVVVADEDKNMVNLLVWPSMFSRAKLRLVEGNVADIKVQSTRDGAMFVENIL